MTEQVITETATKLVLSGLDRIIDTTDLEDAADVMHTLARQAGETDLAELLFSNAKRAETEAVLDCVKLIVAKLKAQVEE